MVADLGLEAGILDRNSLKIVITGRVLRELFHFCKSNKKIIGSVVQSIVGLF